MLRDFDTSSNLYFPISYILQRLRCPGGRPEDGHCTEHLDALEWLTWLSCGPVSTCSTLMYLVHPKNPTGFHHSTIFYHIFYLHFGFETNSSSKTHGAVRPKFLQTLAGAGAAAVTAALEKPAAHQDVSKMSAMAVSRPSMLQEEHAHLAWDILRWWFEHEIKLKRIMFRELGWILKA